MKDRPGETIEDQLVPFLPRLRRFALTLCRSAHQADDLVQSACERALSSAAQFQQGTRFDSWMFRILRNLWIDDLRRKSTRGPEDDITEREDLAGSSGEAQAEARLFLREVTKAIDELAGEQREVLLLVCVEELSYRETADILDVPIGTVMSRLARARKALAEASGISSPPARSEK